ncbi:S1C family serine protease [Alienimonas californiensis]|uniref:Serine protease HtrA n=1 Tax=Alienimonas californiensis TaxID=2527989 RepID=A0A517P8E9_9PLAN|nr:trypsin-like peptidase domain-containing protein [Alienimonas californiensis]QDT15650.1 Putative serine protease HtrA [Alienimonas californiensis]
MPSAAVPPSLAPAPADATRADAPRARRPWADRAVGALAGAGLFAAGVTFADLGRPGGAELGLGAANVAHAESLNVEQAKLLRDELDETPDRPLLLGGEAIARVSRLASPSVVHIESVYRDDDGGMVEETGSGVLIRHPRWADVQTGRLFVVTNRHVVAGAEAPGSGNVDLRLADGHTVRPTKIWTDQATDLAVLEIANRDLPAIHFGNSDALEIGHFVLALGSPFGLDRSVTLGIVSAKGRRRLDLGTEDLINQDFLQTDAAINPGNSGGPLIDLRGRLVGINTAIASSSGGSEGIGFSIPSNLVRRVFDELLTHGRVRRAYLGVQLDSGFDRRAIGTVGLDRLYGARVQIVKQGTPAADAGLRRNDVVLRFGTIEVQDLDHLINLVSLTPVGEQVQLTVLRERREVPMTLVLAERPDPTPRRPEPTSRR